MQYEDDDWDERYEDDPLAVVQGCAFAMFMSLVILVIASVVLSALL